MKINLTAKPSSTIKNKTGGWRTYIPKRDLKKCIGCGICARVCPEKAIKMVRSNYGSSKSGTAKKLKPQVDYDYCKGCGLCAAECPVKAIEMKLDKK